MLIYNSNSNMVIANYLGKNLEYFTNLIFSGLLGMIALYIHHDLPRLGHS